MQKQHKRLAKRFFSIPGILLASEVAVAFLHHTTPLEIFLIPNLKVGNKNGKKSFG
jgi:hypothetical protein